VSTNTTVTIIIGTIVIDNFGNIAMDAAGLHAIHVAGTGAIGTTGLGATDAIHMCGIPEFSTAATLTSNTLYITPPCRQHLVA